MSRNQHFTKQAQAVRLMRLVPPATRAQLHAWLRCFASLQLPERGVCPGHHTPLDYLDHVFFERGPTPDTVVWACRGGGKTMIGAAATLLDLLFKPGIQVRILGGSQEQSQKMYTYLCALIRDRFADQLAGGEKAITRKGFVLRNGSRVEILTQSQRAVRGTRVQKMRCDEVELFDPQVWSAAQLTTRSLLADEPAADPFVVQASACPSPSRPVVARGAVEVFSTMHRPSGLMAQLVARAACPLAELPATLDDRQPKRKVFTWCVWDVVGKCLESRRACEPCPLWPWCQGRARHGEGFVPVADVLAVRERSTKTAWESEMLCHMPYPENQVFAAFREETHVRAWPAVPFAAGQTVDAGGVGGRGLRMETLIAGIDYGWRQFACVWVGLLRDERGRRVAWVLEEYVQGQRTLEGHAAAIRERGVGVPAALAGVYYADVAGRQHDAHSGRTSEGVLRAAGLNVKSRAMQIADGIRRINELLEPPETWGGGEALAGGRGGERAAVPRLLVDPRCRRVIEALTKYGMKGGVPVKDGVHDHVVDALRYALVGQEGGGGKVEVREY